MSVDRDPKTIPSLVTDLVEQLSTLVRTEGQLLRSELKENASRRGAASWKSPPERCFFWQR